MSIDLIQPMAVVSPPEQASTLAPASRSRGVPAVLAVLAPVVAAGVAYSVHAFVPDKQEILLTWLTKLPDWQHPFVVLVAGVGAASILAALLQSVWQPSRSWVRHYAPLMAGALFVLTFWDVITAKKDWLEQPYFPGPDEVFASLLEDRRILLDSAWHSLILLLSGYLAGVLMGVTTGVLIGWFPRVRYWGMPVLKIVGPIPATALIPLMMMISRHTYPCAVALIGFTVWFPVTMLTSSGIANVRLSYLDVARTLGAGRLYLIFRVAIPSALPNIFIGLFMGLGASFLTLIAAETLGVPSGLGSYLLWRKGAMEYAKVYADLIVMALFFSTLMTILFKLRDHVLKWQKGVIRW